MIPSHSNYIRYQSLLEQLKDLNQSILLNRMNVLSNETYYLYAVSKLLSEILCELMQFSCTIDISLNIILEIFIHLFDYIKKIYDIFNHTEIIRHLCVKVWYHLLTWCSIDFYSDITAVWIELFVQIKWFIQRYFKEITTRIVRYLYLSVKIARWLVENGECWRCMLIILLFGFSRFDYWECFMLLWFIVFLIFPSFCKKRHWRNMKNYSRIKYLLRSSNHLLENL